MSFENIFVSEVFADFFISFLQKLFMRIVLKKLFGDAHTSKWSQRIYIYIYINKYIYIYIYIYIYSVSAQIGIGTIRIVRIVTQVLRPTFLRQDF